MVTSFPHQSSKGLLSANFVLEDLNFERGADDAPSLPIKPWDGLEPQAEVVIRVAFVFAEEQLLTTK